MQQAQRNPANRCFFGQQNPEQRKEEKIKTAFKKSKEIRDAEAQLNNLLLQFKGRKSILQLLPVIKMRYPRPVLDLAIRRVENQRLKLEDKIYFEKFKASLTEE